jgi:hypothetical protein
MQKKQSKPNFFFVVAIVAVICLAYIARKKNTDEMTFTVDNTAPVERYVATDAQSQSIEDLDNPQEPPPSEVADKDLKPLKQWIREESSSINSPKMNLKAREEELSEKIKNFGARQLAHLQKISEDKAAPMNERILSTFMLGKSELSRENLIGLASRPTDQTSFEPHTEGEIKATSDRAIKLMAVDAIVARNDSVENRLKDLQEIINKSNDLLVKDYAQKKTREVR